MNQEVVLGNGVGLRPTHYPFILEHTPRVDWFEVVSENYMDTEGRPIHILEQIRKDYPIVLHGVSLSIGSADPIDPAYIRKLKRLIDRIEPAKVSDHLCWTGVGGINLHDLLPLPFTLEALEHVVSRVHLVQDLLKREIALENPSSYVSFQLAEMREWEFIKEVSIRSGCKILLDINNIYVNAFNHQFDPKEFLNAIPIDRISYFHLAGHRDMGTYYFDTHDGAIIPPVWDLYRAALKRFGNVDTLIEWDAQIPEFPVLMSELDKVRTLKKELCVA